MMGHVLQTNRYLHIGALSLLVIALAAAIPVADNENKSIFFFIFLIALLVISVYELKLYTESNLYFQPVSRSRPSNFCHRSRPPSKRPWTQHVPVFRMVAHRTVLLPWLPVVLMRVNLNASK